MKNIKVLLLVCVLVLSSCGKDKENLQDNQKTTYSEESVVLEKNWTWEVLENKNKDCWNRTLIVSEKINPIYPFECWPEKLYINKCWVYEGNRKLDWIDINTFQALKSGYFKDKYNIFRCGRLMKWADVKTFEVINDGYSKDKNRVYSVNSETTDPNTFEVLKNGYSKDKNNVYFNHWYMWTIELEWADSKSFEVLKYDYARDKNNIYYENENLGNLT